jgi:hypothetical protein
VECGRNRCGPAISTKTRVATARCWRLYSAPWLGSTEHGRPLLMIVGAGLQEKNGCLLGTNPLPPPVPVDTGREYARGILLGRYPLIAALRDAVGENSFCGGVLKCLELGKHRAYFDAEAPICGIW